eukprot:SAG31_NODE_9287_length_1304_cov_1.205809_2_plen_179_part_01
MYPGRKLLLNLVLCLAWHACVNTCSSLHSMHRCCHVGCRSMLQLYAIRQVAVRIALDHPWTMYGTMPAKFEFPGGCPGRRDECDAVSNRGGGASEGGRGPAVRCTITVNFSSRHSNTLVSGDELAIDGDTNWRHVASNSPRRSRLEVVHMLISWQLTRHRESNHLEASPWMRLPRQKF